MSNFDQIKRAEKRAEHFVGRYRECRLGWGDWSAYIKRGKYPFAENHMLMRPVATDCEGVSRQERLNGWPHVDEFGWLDSLAAAINRYIDVNKISDDHDFRYVLRWFQQHLTFRAAGL